MIGLIVRRRWLILLPFAAGAALAPLLARYAPPRHRSSALILVIPQQVPDNSVTPTVRQPFEERLPAITDRILTRSRLERIIREMDLYKAERSRNGMEDAVSTMRLDIGTSPVGKTVDAFRIGYVSDDQEKATKVTERLVSLYLDENSKDREVQADHASESLETQLADAKRRLIEQGKKLEDYRKSHAGQLPSPLQGNVQAIQSANVQLQSLNESSSRAQERRLQIERQMADERLERTIAELSERLAREAAVSDTTATRAKPLIAADAAQERKDRDLQAELTGLDYQLEVNRTEADRLKKTIAEYQARVDALPTRESELVELARDYSTIQTVYANLLVKSQDSAIAVNLERRKIGDQFHLVDQASKPEGPSNQRQRQTILASGAAAGLALGLLIVGLLGYRDSSFGRAEEVHEALSVPVLASIPVMSSSRQRRAAMRRRIAMDVGGATVLVAAMVVLVLWRP